MHYTKSQHLAPPSKVAFITYPTLRKNTVCLVQVGFVFWLILQFVATICSWLPIGVNMIHFPSNSSLNIQHLSGVFAECSCNRLRHQLYSFACGMVTPLTHAVLSQVAVSLNDWAWLIECKSYDGMESAGMALRVRSGLLHLTKYTSFCNTSGWTLQHPSLHFRQLKYHPTPSLIQYYPPLATNNRLLLVYHLAGACMPIWQDCRSEEYGTFMYISPANHALPLAIPLFLSPVSPLTPNTGSIGANECQTRVSLHLRMCVSWPNCVLFKHFWISEIVQPNFYFS